MAKLLDEVREQIRLRHYSIRTEQAYLHWIKKYILFHNKRHPNQMGQLQITQLLSYLAVNCHVAASTQNQALSAILFLYKNVLHQQVEWLDNIERAKKPLRLPIVLSKEEIFRIFAYLIEPQWLIANLLYGSGLRLMEALRLRVKDIDFTYHQIFIRDGKGNK